MSQQVPVEQHPREQINLDSGDTIVLQAVNREWTAPDSLQSSNSYGRGWVGRIYALGFGVRLRARVHKKRVLSSDHSARISPSFIIDGKDHSN